MIPQTDHEAEASVPMPEKPAPPTTETARLLAAAPSSYEPRLPLANVLGYAAAVAADPESQGWAKVAWVCALTSGAIAPRRTTKR